MFATGRQNFPASNDQHFHDRHLDTRLQMEPPQFTGIAVSVGHACTFLLDADRTAVGFSQRFIE